MKKSTAITLAIAIMGIVGLASVMYLIPEEAINSEKLPPQIGNAADAPEGKSEGKSPVPLKLQGVSKLQVNLPDFSKMSAGNPMDFHIPHEDKVYHGIIESSDLNDSGSRSIIGRFDVDGKGYRFVFTIGQQITFGTLHTPLGRYQLEARNGNGVLVSTAEINRNRDFSKPDFIIRESVRPLRN